MLLQINIIVQATAMAYIVSGENVVMREYSMKFILILKMEKNKQIHCIGILYSQTFLEGHYEIVIYSNVNTKSLMLVILLKVHRLAQKIHSCCSLSCFFLPTTRPHFRNSIDIRVYALRGTWLKVVSFKNLHIFLQKRFQC